MIDDIQKWEQKTLPKASLELAKLIEELDGK